MFLIFQLRPTPPHLTSAAAESYLAQACENESQNAKRMRMGLEPLPVCTDELVQSQCSLITVCSKQLRSAFVQSNFVGLFVNMVIQIMYIRFNIELSTVKLNMRTHLYCHIAWG